MKKLYIIVRNDLPPGLQIAQSCHAQREFSKGHPDVLRDWEENLVVLQVANEKDLRSLEMELRENSLSVSVFEEPDLDGSKTAIAVEGAAKPLLSSLGLALRAA